MRWRKFHLIEFAIDHFHTWKKDNCECISVHVKFLIEHLKYYAYKWKKKPQTLFYPCEIVISKCENVGFTCDKVNVAGFHLPCFNSKGGISDPHVKRNVKHKET